MEIDVKDDDRLVEFLKRNYSCLQGLYRMSSFEARVNYIHTWKTARSLFYELKAEAGEREAGNIAFKSAIENFYLLIKYVEEERPGVVERQAVLLLKSKSLLYEAFDYTLHVPDSLETYFEGIAAEFDKHSSPEDMERWTEKFNQGRPLEPLDERTKVIKDLLIAALLGVNHHIRQHSRESYKRALRLLEKIHRYVVNELPRQHQKERESFGLLGLTLFLKGRVLMAQGAYDLSRSAFRGSAEAYVNRLRQKEEFLRKEYITDTEFRQKTSVTLRRVALVTAFGDGYLSFLSSQINRALESLTLARATLTLNSGRIYLAYVDVWYWACQRAKHSSDEKVIDRVIEGLKISCKTLSELAGNTRYEYRASVELALAFYYKAKLSAQDSDELFNEADRLLDRVIKYAGAINQNREYKNPHLFGDALIYKSYLLRAHARSRRKSDQEPKDLHELMSALEAAEQACEVGEKQGTAPLRSEAWAALGAVYTDLVEYRQRQGEEFSHDFDRALKALRRSLKDTGGNVRLDAAAYLRLSRLCLLNKDTEIMAYDYFQQWRKLEERVEHAYLNELARELEGKDKIVSPFLLVEAGETLEYDVWKEKLVEALHDVAIRRFIHEELLDDEPLSDKDLELQFRNYLKDHLKYSPGKVSTLVKQDGLFKKLKKMMKRPPT